MRPIRRKQHIQVTEDPQTGQRRILGLSQEEDTLDGGSIDTSLYRHQFFLDCGCDSSRIGGRCFQCGAISCTACHGRCYFCQMPICLQHSHFLETPNQEGIRLCGRCHSQITRKQKFQKIKRTILSFFIQPDSDDE